MTPPRLSQIECPACHDRQWIIDSDDRGTGAPGGRYAERLYSCRTCATKGAGWTVTAQAPPTFLLQPCQSWPMSHEEFDRWVLVLKQEFPDHPKLARLGTTFVPFTLEEFEAARQRHEREHPVYEMRDQDGGCRVDPTASEASDWVSMMVSGDCLDFARRGGGMLRVIFAAPDAFQAICTGPDGEVLVEVTGLTARAVSRAAESYVAGSVPSCLSELRPPTPGILGPFRDRLTGH